MIAVTLIIMSILMVRDSAERDMVKLVVKVSDEFRGFVDDVMRHFEFKFYRKIIDGIYTYANEHPDSCTDTKIEQLSRIIEGKVEYVSRSRNMIGTISPQYDMLLQYEDTTDAPASQAKDCGRWFDSFSDIHDIWKRSITGKGVVVAIVDNGIDDLDPSLRTKINKLFSYNFVNDIQSTPAPSTTCFSHGNVYAKILVGECDQSRCRTRDCAITPEITIADLKVGSWAATTRQHYIPTIDGETLSRGLAAYQDVIDIYYNTWELDISDVELQDYTLDILRKGFHKGRRGKGNIFVFPAGKPGNDFASNYTITVGWIETGVSLSHNSVVNAATLISVVTNINTNILAYTNEYKTSRLPHVDVSSAATAIVSGIIALALQANPNLTARDVKHLLVQSATHKGLQETQNFKQNGAGYHYHKSLGFGYPDVNRMLVLAKTWEKLQEQQSFTIKFDSSWVRASSVDINVGCEDSQSCTHRLEQLRLKVQIGFSKSSPGMSVIATSPKNTPSVLFEQKQTSGDQQGHDFVQMTFFSNHFWVEDPVGLWSIKIMTDFDAPVPNNCYVEVLEITFDTTGSHGRLTETKTSRLYVSGAVISMLSSMFTGTIVIFLLVYCLALRAKHMKRANTDEDETSEKVEML